MKKSLLMMALGAIVALTSCQPEQSQLDFNNVSETATVQGYVYINQGYTQDGATFVAKSVPAAGCGVLFLCSQPCTFKGWYPSQVCFTYDNLVFSACT